MTRRKEPRTELRFLLIAICILVFLLIGCKWACAAFSRKEPSHVHRHFLLILFIGGTILCGWFLCFCGNAGQRRGISEFHFLWIASVIVLFIFFGWQLWGSGALRRDEPSQFHLYYLWILLFIGSMLVFLSFAWEKRASIESNFHLFAILIVVFAVLGWRLFSKKPVSSNSRICNCNCEYPPLQTQQRDIDFRDFANRQTQRQRSDISRLEAKVERLEGQFQQKDREITKITRTEAKNTAALKSHIGKLQHERDECQRILIGYKIKDSLGTVMASIKDCMVQLKDAVIGAFVTMIASMKEHMVQLQDALKGSEATKRELELEAQLVEARSLIQKQLVQLDEARSIIQEQESTISQCNEASKGVMDVPL